MWFSRRRRAAITSSSGAVSPTRTSRSPSVLPEPGVYTPGVNDIDFLLEQADLPEDVEGATVLDIGATNGGVAFELERRGAGRVVAVDIYSADWFGLEQLKALLNSRVEYLCASVYELPAKLDEQFDIVAFCGVLYHLRHPLLALDVVRALTRGRALIETAVCDRSLSLDPRKRRTTGMKKGMEESYIED